MEFQAVVLAAGHGSRMTDLTARTPKALLPIANKPMVWYPVQMLEKAGFEEAIIVVLESQQADIQKALVEICGVKMRLEFVSIPNEDWGTADSLRHIHDKIKTDILLVSCDLVTDLPLHRLADVHRTYDATLTMLLAQSPSTAEMSAPGGKANRKIERDVVGLDEKGNRVLFMSSMADFEERISFKKSFFKKHPCMNVRTRLLDGHLYLMKKWVLDLLVNDRSITTIKGELLPYLVRKQTGQPHVPPDREHGNPDVSLLSVNTKPDIYSMAVEDEMTKLARDMSTWRDHHGDMADCFHGDKIRCYAYVMEEGLCLRANTVLTYCEANRQTPRQLAVLAPNKDISLVHPSAALQPKSQVGPDSMVGEGTTMAEKVSIKRSTIGKHCTIGEKVKVANCLIMDYVTITEGSSLSGCVVCDNAHLGEKCELKDCLVGSSQSVMAMGKFTNEVIVDVGQLMEI